MISFLKKTLITFICIASIGGSFLAPLPALGQDDGVVPDSAWECGRFQITCLFGEAIYGTANKFAALTGTFMDVAIKFFVFEMKDTLEAENGIFRVPITSDSANSEINMPVYTQVWVLFRDLANFTFIFILIYAAVATILNVNTQTVNAKKIIPTLLIVAVLINFSMFFVQIGIDFSNYMSHQFYTNVHIETTDSEGVNIVATAGLSHAFSNLLNLTSFLESFSGTSSGKIQDPFTTGLLAGAFLILAGFIFLGVAVLLFFRFFMLLILMVSSPIAMAAYILPSTRKQIFDKWKGSLMGQLTFAPVLFAMLYLSVRFLGYLNPTGVNLGDDDSMWLYRVLPMIISYTIAGAFLVFSLVVATMLGAKGGKLAGAVSFGGMAWTGRNTFGKIANRYVSKNEARLQQLRAEGGVRGRIAGAQLKSVKSVRDSGFDLRTSKLGQTKFSHGGKSASLGAMSTKSKKEMEKGYGDRLKERKDEKDKEVEEISRWLTEEQADRYRNRRETEMEGVRGFVQMFTHREVTEEEAAADPTGKLKAGALVAKEGVQNIHDKFNNGIRGVGNLLEEAVRDIPDSGNMFLDNRFVGGAVSRYKDSLINVIDRGKNAMLRASVLEGSNQELTDEENIELAAIGRKEIREAREEMNGLRSRRAELDGELIAAVATGNTARINLIQGEIGTINEEINNRREERRRVLQNTNRIRTEGGEIEVDISANDKGEINNLNQELWKQNDILKDLERAEQGAETAFRSAGGIIGSDEHKKYVETRDEVVKQRMVVRNKEEEVATKITESGWKNVQGLRQKRWERGAFVNSAASEKVTSYKEARAKERSEKERKEQYRMMAEVWKTTSDASTVASPTPPPPTPPTGTPSGGSPTGPGRP